MNLTPRQIQEKQFHDAFRGYSHEEVDTFLDAVAEAFNQVFQQNQTLHHRLKEMETELVQAKGSEDMLKRMLVTAQETADKAVNEARAKGQSIEQQASSRAEAIIAEAEKKAQEIVVAAVTKERETQDALEGIKRFDREYRTRMRAFIESQLRVLDEGPAPAPRPEPAEQAPPIKPSAPAQPTQPPVAPTSPTPAATSVPSRPSEAPAPVAPPVSVTPPASAAALAPASAAAPASAEPPAPDVRSAVSEIMRRTEGLNSGGFAASGAPESARRAAATPPDPPVANGAPAIPSPEVIRLPKEEPALVAPPGEPEEERSIDELFWGED